MSSKPQPVPPNRLLPIKAFFTIDRLPLAGVSVGARCHGTPMHSAMSPMRQACAIVAGAVRRNLLKSLMVGVYRTDTLNSITKPLCLVNPHIGRLCGVKAVGYSTGCRTRAHCNRGSAPRPPTSRVCSTTIRMRARVASRDDVPERQCRCLTTMFLTLTGPIGPMRVDATRASR